MNTISTSKAPAAIGPYSQAIVSGNTIYTSGQLPIDPETGQIDAKDIKSQTKQSIENLAAVLEAGNSSLNKVIKTTCYLKDIKDFASFNEIYSKYFSSKPARSCFEVANLPKDALVEIEAIAETDC